MVKKHKPDFDATGYKTIRGNGTFPLNDERLNRILNANSCDMLPSIKLAEKKFYLPPRRRQLGNNNMYFEVTDGRHRVAAALIQNCTHIRATLQPTQ